MFTPENIKENAQKLNQIKISKTEKQRKIKI